MNLFQSIIKESLTETTTVPCKKTRDFGDFPYKTAIFE